MRVVKAMVVDEVIFAVDNQMGEASLVEPIIIPEVRKIIIATLINNTEPVI
jgi:hypothetical protein